MEASMVNPLRGGRGRPLHPMLVHFPIALYPVSLLFDWLSHRAEDGNGYVKGAFVLLLCGLIGSALAALAGFADYLLIPAGTRAWRLATVHLSAQLLAAAVILVDLLVRRRDLDLSVTPLGPVLLSAAGVALVASGAALGHELVYRYARRVEPDPGLEGAEDLGPLDFDLDRDSR
jgi:uncharacterized membrane protein